MSSLSAAEKFGCLNRSGVANLPAPRRAVLLDFIRRQMTIRPEEAGASGDTYFSKRGPKFRPFLRRRRRVFRAS